MTQSIIIKSALIILCTQICISNSLHAQLKSKKISVAYVCPCIKGNSGKVSAWLNIYPVEKNGHKIFIWNKTGNKLELFYTFNSRKEYFDRVCLSEAEYDKVKKDMSRYDLGDFKLEGIYHKTDEPEEYINLYYINPRQDSILCISYVIADGIQFAFYYSNRPVNPFANRGVVFKTRG